MFYPSYAKILFTLSLGGLAQLGERFAGSEEVVGSIPIVSTNNKILYNLTKSTNAHYTEL